MNSPDIRPQITAKTRRLEYRGLAKLFSSSYTGLTECGEAIGLEEPAVERKLQIDWRPVRRGVCRSLLRAWCNGTSPAPHARSLRDRFFNSFDVGLDVGVFLLHRLDLPGKLLLVGPLLLVDGDPVLSSDREIAEPHSHQHCATRRAPAAGSGTSSPGPGRAWSKTSWRCFCSFASNLQALRPTDCLQW